MRQISRHTSQPQSRPQSHLRHLLRTTVLITALITAFTPNAAFAETSTTDRTTVMIETDPSTFAFDGFASHIRLSFPSAKQWTFGAGVYGMTFPGVLVDLNPENKGEGWTQNLRIGYGLFVDRYFGDDGVSGFFVGAQLALQRYEISKSDQGDKRAKYTTVLFMPRAGYLWKPMSDSGLYLMPWLGIGGTAKIAGDTKVNGAEFDVSPLLTFATLHVGWQF